MFVKGLRSFVSCSAALPVTRSLDKNLFEVFTESTDNQAPGWEGITVAAPCVTLLETSAGLI